MERLAVVDEAEDELEDEVDVVDEEARVVAMDVIWVKSFVVLSILLNEKHYLATTMDGCMDGRAKKERERQWGD